MATPGAGRVDPTEERLRLRARFAGDLKRDWEFTCRSCFAALCQRRGTAALARKVLDEKMSERKASSRW